MLGGTAQVPAAHHQAIDRIGSGLLTVAWTQDQVVEAIELQGHRWGLGVQWNPEDGDDLRLFETLVSVAKAAAAQTRAAPGRSDRPVQALVEAPRRPLLAPARCRCDLSMARWR